MMKQQTLVFLEQECLETIWEQFPEPARDELTRQLARLMARSLVAQIRALRADHYNPEVSDDSNDG
jgi:predicted transcriptional regulator